MHNTLACCFDGQIQDLNCNLIYSFQVTVDCGLLEIASEVYHLHFQF